jgi:type IV secretory pathway VirJ component
MRKFLIWVFAFTLLVVLVVFILDSTRISKQQSLEIKKKYSNDSNFIRDDLSNLPLLLFETKKIKSDCFMILFPGDGGWRDFIDTVAQVISKRGMPVVGFNTIPYFSETKSTKQIINDLKRVIHNFSTIWNLKKVILCGYSFTAEILPFAYNDMDTGLSNCIEKLVLISPSNLADFRVSPVYYYNPANGKPVIPQLKKIPREKILIFCDRYKRNICNYLPEKHDFCIYKVNYNHLYTGKNKVMSELIANKLGL